MQKAYDLLQKKNQILVQQTETLRWVIVAQMVEKDLISQRDNLYDILANNMALSDESENGFDSDHTAKCNAIEEIEEFIKCLTKEFEEQQLALTK